MLTEGQSIAIVTNCIRAISKVPKVDLTGTLDDAEITEGKRVNRLVNKIVTGKIGVKSESHDIDVDFFNAVDPDTIVDDLVVIVRDNATPVLG